MNSRKLFQVLLRSFIGVSAVGLLLTLFLCENMPDAWEHRTAAEAARKICFTLLAVSSGAHVLFTLQAKKRSEGEAAAVRAAQPARRSKVKAKVKAK